MSERPGSFRSVERNVSAIASAENASEVFRHVLAGLATSAPRGGLLMSRRGAFVGGGSFGYDEQVASRFRAAQVEPGPHFPGRVLDETQRTGGALLHPGSHSLDFGQPRPGEALAMPIRMRGKPLALLLVERSPGEAPWEPEAISLLVRCAELRLELDFARWKVGELEHELAQRTEATASTAGRAAPRAPAGVPEEASAGCPPNGDTRDRAEDDRGVPVSSALGKTSALEPVTHPGSASGAREAAENPVHASARRFARLVATDIRLYNEDAVLTGRKHRDLSERLREHLDRGRETFERRFPELGETGRRILREAFVQVLAGGDEALLPPV